MKLCIKEDLDNMKPDYGVLFKDPKTNKNALCIFYNKEDAFEFFEDCELLGRGVFDKWDPDIMTKDTGKGFEPDKYGKCWYVAYTSDGEEYLQEVRVINREPVIF